MTDKERTGAKILGKLCVGIGSAESPWLVGDVLSALVASGGCGCAGMKACVMSLFSNPDFSCCLLSLLIERRPLLAPFGFI